MSFHAVFLKIVNDARYINEMSGGGNTAFYYELNDELYELWEFPESNKIIRIVNCTTGDSYYDQR